MEFTFNAANEKRGAFRGMYLCDYKYIYLLLVIQIVPYIPLIRVTKAIGSAKIYNLRITAESGIAR